jgi:mannose-6-phosphate isomerase-like protein (cupin superfamily)
MMPFELSIEIMRNHPLAEFHPTRLRQEILGRALRSTEPAARRQRRHENRSGLECRRPLMKGGAIDMRYLKTTIVVTALAVVLVPTLYGQGPQQESLVWAPVPSSPNPWVAPNKLHTKLVDVLASHDGEKSWRQAIVRDVLLSADYVQMAPGTKTPRQFQPDSPIWWVVQDGEVRFTIEGQQPFVAAKGFLVQVPYRNIYQLEAAGPAPALFFEVKVSDSPTMYPADETPVPVPGMEFVKVRISGRASYTDTVRPFLDFHGALAAGRRVAGPFVSDARAFANVIRGLPQADDPKDKGHFHEVSAEFWFVLEGTINYKIGDLPIFDAVQGDVVFVPKQMWHRAHHGGTGYSTRLAMNGYPQLLHNYQPKD